MGVEVVIKYRGHLFAYPAVPPQATARAIVTLRDLWVTAGNHADWEFVEDVAIL